MIERAIDEQGALQRAINGAATGEVDADVFFEKYADVFINLDTEIPEIRPKLYIQDKAVGSDKNIIALAAGQKGGKSAIAGALLSIALNPLACDAPQSIKIEPNLENKAIIAIETEQPKPTHKRNIERIYKRAGLSKTVPHFKSPNLKKMPFNEYRQFVEQLFDACSNRFGGVHFAVIDGIAEFVKSVNDEEGAIDIVNFFMQLADKHDCLIILVIHFNAKGVEKNTPRGHLGATLLRKCEATLSLQKENGYNVLTGSDFRELDRFEPMPFYFDEAKGYHCFFEPGEAPNSLIERLTPIAQKIFKTEMTSGDAAAAIGRLQGIETRKANTMLSEMLAAGIVDKIKRGRNNIYSLKAKKT